MAKRRIPKYLSSVAKRYREKPSPSEIGEALRRATNPELAEPWTQAELAELFGTQQQAISRWLRWERESGAPEASDTPEEVGA